MSSFDEFREWFSQTNPSEANRAQFDRYLAEVRQETIDEATANKGRVVVHLAGTPVVSNRSIDGSRGAW